LTVRVADESSTQGKELMKRQTVLAATWRDGLFVIGNDEHSHELSGVPVKWVAPDGHGGALAIVGSNSLSSRSPEGEWTTVVSSEFELSCCVAVGKTVYVGTDDARVLRLSEGSDVLEPVEAFDKVPGRVAWFAGSAIVDGQRVGPPLGIRSLAANSTGSILFANVHVGGIPRSLDGGRSWHPTIDIQSDVHEVCAHQTHPEIVVAAAAVGLCISRDSGETWEIDTEGLHTTHCYAVAISGDDVFVAVSQDPFAAPGRVYRRSIGSNGAFEAVGGGMPAWTEGMVDTHCIATKSSFVAVADKGGNLYSSNDFGRTWSSIRTGLPSPSSILIC
jgi:hypothetical protein